MGDLQHVDSPQATSPFALFLRIFWMILGNLILGVCVLLILTGNVKGVSVVDAVYVATIPLVVGARYMDVARYSGKNSYGQPSTLADWRRYSTVLAGVGLFALAAAHVLASVL